MGTRVNAKSAAGIVTPVGGQVMATNVSARPKIRHPPSSLPRSASSTSAQTDSSGSSRGVLRTGNRDVTSSGQSRMPSSSKARSSTALVPKTVQNKVKHKSKVKSRAIASPVNFPVEIDDDFEDNEGQDVRFINVPNETEQSASKASGGREIIPKDIILRSQESSPDKVYEIDLHACSISGINHLESFRKVRMLDLSCNSISQIENLFPCTDLRDLKLYDNNITEIENMERLKDLEQLQLQHNKIKSIGKGLQGLRKLKVLRLDSNMLSAFEMRELAGCGMLISLDIGNNNLTNISAISCLQNLQELFIVNNKIRSVADISRCKRLQEVDLSHNRLIDISGLKGLPNLKVLRLSHNHFPNTKTLGKLKCLQEIYLDHNRLTDVSSLVDFYPSLQILDISNNHLEHYDDLYSLCGMVELVELFVSGNPFSMHNDRLQYSNDLHKHIPQLDFLDGAQLKKPCSKTGTPLMRPMSAASVVSSKQVEAQIKFLDLEMSDFESSLSHRFQAMRAQMNYLPRESVSRPISSCNTPSPSSSRPSSKASKRSRIKLAQEFAHQIDLTDQIDLT